MNHYNFSKIWVSKIIESKIPFRIENPLLASVVKLGLIPNLYFILFYLIRCEYITTGFLVAYTFALIWLNLGPFLIWYYDERLLPIFFYKALDIVPNHEKMAVLAKKYDNLFSQKFWVVTVPWTIFLVYIYIHGLPALSKGGVFGMNDFCYWVGIIGIVWAALLTSTGFWGILTTMFAIREISKESLSIDPLHPDKLGGLSCVGYYAIGTTILASSGSFFLPAGFQLVSGTKILIPYVYFAVFLFSAFILLSFLYPTVIVHQKAKSIRDDILDKLRKKHIELRHTLDSNNQNHMRTMLSYLELYRLRNEYLDYKTVKLYPFEVEIFIKLISSVILPVIFLLIQIYWGSVMT